MPKPLRKIGRMFILAWSITLTYRGDVFLWTLTEAIAPLIALAVWITATSQSDGILQPRDTVTYYILSMLIIIATAAWTSYFLTQEILDGTLVKNLIRPISVFWEHIADNIVVKSLRLALPLPVAIAVFWLSPQWFSSSIYDASRITLAILSILLGAAISFVADAILATLAFWIEDAQQIIAYHYLLWTVGSGVLIPYIFLPEVARTALSFLPYRYIVSAPLEILVTQASTSTPFFLISMQLAWLFGLTIILRVLWLKGLKRYAIPGQ